MWSRSWRGRRFPSFSGRPECPRNPALPGICAPRGRCGCLATRLTFCLGVRYAVATPCAASLEALSALVETLRPIVVCRLQWFPLDSPGVADGNLLNGCIRRVPYNDFDNSFSPFLPARLTPNAVTYRVTYTAGSMLVRFGRCCRPGSNASGELFADPRVSGRICELHAPSRQTTPKRARQPDSPRLPDAYLPRSSGVF